MIPNTNLVETCTNIYTKNCHVFIKPVNKSTGLHKHKKVSLCALDGAVPWGVELELEVREEQNTFCRYNK